MHYELNFVLALPDFVRSITREYGSIRWCDERQGIVFSFKDEYFLKAFIGLAKDYDLWSEPSFSGTKILYEVAGQVY